MTAEKCLRVNEKEKKRSYGNWAFQIENGSFTPQFFVANGRMGNECIRFYKRLAEMIADKWKAPISVVTVLELWFASPYWDPRWNGWEVWEIQDTKDIGIKINALIKID